MNEAVNRHHARKGKPAHHQAVDVVRVDDVGAKSGEVPMHLTSSGSGGVDEDAVGLLRQTMDLRALPHGGRRRGSVSIGRDDVDVKILERHQRIDERDADRFDAAARCGGVGGK